MKKNFVSFKKGCIFAADLIGQNRIVDALFVLSISWLTIENKIVMAKKVVATLKTSTGKSFAKVIRMVRSEKTGAYMFKEEIVPSDNVQEYLKKK